MVEHLGDEQSELAVSEHDAVASGLDVDLLQDLEGGGEWLGEDGLLIRDAIGHRVKIRHWNANEVGEGAIRAEDAHHLSEGAVALEALEADRTGLAGEGDRADDALTAQCVGTLFHDPH